MASSSPKKVLLIALGGNALIKKGQAGTIEQQFENLRGPIRQIARLSRHYKIIVTHGNGYTHGYEIDRVAHTDGKSVIILADDHGLRISGDVTEECYFPRRKITGVNRFVIAKWSAWQASGMARS